MTTITLNREAIKTKIDKERNIDELLDFIEEFHLKDQEVITLLKLDGKEYFINSKNSYHESKIKDFQTIEINSKKMKEVAIAALHGCKELISQVKQSIFELIDLYAESNFGQAEVKFQNIIDKLQAFIGLISNTYTVIGHIHLPEEEDINNYDFLENELLGIFKLLLPAKENDDIVMVQEILKNDLIENLERWENHSLPNLIELL